MKQWNDGWTTLLPIEPVNHVLFKQAASWFSCYSLQHLRFPNLNPFNVWLCAQSNFTTANTHALCSLLSTRLPKTQEGPHPSPSRRHSSPAQVWWRSGPVLLLLLFLLPWGSDGLLHNRADASVRTRVGVNRDRSNLKSRGRTNNGVLGYKQGALLQSYLIRCQVTAYQIPGFREE